MRRVSGPVAEGFEGIITLPSVPVAMTGDDVTLLMNPMAIDRALAQTAQAGLGYAEIPLPSYYVWLAWMQEELVKCVDEERPCDVRFKWFHYCIGDLPADDENVHLCLQPRDHEGCCR